MDEHEGWLTAVQLAQAAGVTRAAVTHACRRGRFGDGQTRLQTPRGEAWLIHPRYGDPASYRAAVGAPGRPRRVAPPRPEAVPRPQGTEGWLTLVQLAQAVGRHPSGLSAHCRAGRFGTGAVLVASPLGEYWLVHPRYADPEVYERAVPAVQRWRQPQD